MSCVAGFAVTANPATQLTQPSNITLQRNQPGSLSVTATGTGTLQYQWYQGASGNTSNPAPNGNGPTLSVGPYPKRGTNQFWVRVTSATCTGSVANSATVTVTVN